MRPEKILAAIASAIGYLEDSIFAFAKKDETEVVNNVWRAAANLEYALFLLSLEQQDETKNSSWKSVPHSKQTDIEPLLIQTKDLIETAKENVKTEKLLDAHKKAWIARGHLLRIHEILEKKRKSTQ